MSPTLADPPNPPSIVNAGSCILGLAEAMSGRAGVGTVGWAWVWGHDC